MLTLQEASGFTLFPILAYWGGIFLFSRIGASQQFNLRAKPYFRTERPRNYCESCGHDWYPRNRDRSLKCGQCGATTTRIVPFPWDEWMKLSINVGGAFAFFLFPVLAYFIVGFLRGGGFSGMELVIGIPGALLVGYPPYWLNKKMVHRTRSRLQLHWSPDLAG